MDGTNGRKRRRRTLRFIGLLLGVILGWWAGAKLTGGQVEQNENAPAPASRPAD